ncbi:MAG: type II 3-dehydroquinate dehydratase [Bacteroidetes bacterium]|nr:type II 3-dehydroquinate dehydratase [Bacteroidota bacterium]
MIKIMIINGPNLNLLGTRETNIYGDQTFEDFLEDLKEGYFDFSIAYFQSNHEGEIIDKLQEAEKKNYKGIILNAGGFTHTSVAIRDCVAAIKTPVIEVHISNIYAREEFRHKSLLSGVCKGIIAGFGLESYALALDSFAE